MLIPTVFPLFFLAHPGFTKGWSFLEWINSIQTHVQQQDLFFYRLQSDCLLSSASFFPGKSIIPYQLCLLLWLYITLLQLCFLTNNCLFQCRWYFNFDGIYPEGIHLMDVSPGSAGILPCALNVMLQECTNKVLDKSYLPGTVWSRKDLLQWTGILMKRKMYIKKKN